LLQQDIAEKREGRQRRQSEQLCHGSCSFHDFISRKERDKMAKVKKEIVEAALVKLVDNITATMPSTTYKFILGGAAGLLSVSRLDKIKGMLSVFQDENDLVDTDKLKVVYKSAFKAAGGKF
jgi:hypothetical protein